MPHYDMRFLHEPEKTPWIPVFAGMTVFLDILPLRNAGSSVYFPREIIHQRTTRRRSAWGVPEAIRKHNLPRNFFNNPL